MNLPYGRIRDYDCGAGWFTQEDPIGLAGGMNLYGYADGDPINNSDPFGLCTLKKWTDCKVWSASIGLRLGPGFRARALGARVELGTPSIGLTGELSTGARGHEGDVRVDVEGWSAGAALGNFTIGTESGGCDDMTACSPEVGGDISAQTTAGIVRVSATFHAKQAGIFIVGAARWATDKAAGYIREHLTPQDDEP